MIVAKVLIGWILVAVLYAIWSDNNKQLDLLGGKFKYAPQLWFLMTAPISGPIWIWLEIKSRIEEKKDK